MNWNGLTHQQILERKHNERAPKNITDEKNQGKEGLAQNIVNCTEAARDSESIEEIE